MRSNPVNILVLNCGSSSLKYRLIQMPTGIELLSGEAQRVGVKSAEGGIIIHYVSGEKKLYSRTLPTHLEAFEAVLEIIDLDAKQNSLFHYSLFAHRYVHPGNSFSKTTEIKASNFNLLEKTLPLAPIHNPMSFELIKTCFEKYPHIPQFVVFDTSFHRTIPKSQKMYSIPAKITNKYQLNKVGFHGISHEYVLGAASQFLKTDLTQQKVISCHLGSGGSSVCAIENGKSINSSMGYTPLEGLIMNTRSGDVDPGLIFYYMFHQKISSQEMEIILNKKSGILSLYKVSSDLRDAIKNYSSHENARLAVDLYVQRLHKYIGYYLLLLKKADVLIFTDTLGVEEPFIRKAVCEKLLFWGIEIDTGLNEATAYQSKLISSSNSQAKVVIIPTNEEYMIANNAYKEYSHVYHS